MYFILRKNQHRTETSPSSLVEGVQLPAATHWREPVMPISNSDPCTKCLQSLGLVWNPAETRKVWIHAGTASLAWQLCLLCCSHGFFWHRLGFPGLTLCPAAVLQSPHSHGISFQCLWNHWHWCCEVRPVWVPEPKHFVWICELECKLPFFFFSYFLG